MKTTIVSIAVAIVLCGQVVAQEPGPPFGEPSQGPPTSMINPPAEGPPGMPPGAEIKWWKDSALVQKLHISDNQVQKLEKIVHDQQIQEIDLRADLEKQYAVLRFQIEADPPNEAQVLAQIDKVTEARGRLEKSQVERLLAIRRVLTAEQAQKLRDLRPSPASPAPGFGPPEGGPGGPPEGGPGAPPEGTTAPPPSGDAN
jgi:Spy/CpxP family protein refolding chaperone